MSAAAKAYIVRDADAGTRSGELIQLYPYTLKGLTTALEEARFRSFCGTAQVRAVLEDGKTRVIRRFEHGHEVPLTS
jgi:hypothetical protein